MDGWRPFVVAAFDWLEPSPVCWVLSALPCVADGSRRCHSIRLRAARGYVKWSGPYPSVGFVVMSSEVHQRDIVAGPMQMRTPTRAISCRSVGGSPYFRGRQH
ncbi:hypothetical protein CCHR01_16850 [Colletotrichum chrysophilum]|uniref:Uncharacterized protein n=1 Tax=Colletotrichum chrysophilum TaxID=1836956 RepID=A0AAD9A4V1_9PEZI|nr:hypothetical protein CCHR01_16850 [Colletotrichum chrysophilum]